MHRFILVIGILLLASVGNKVQAQNLLDKKLQGIDNFYQTMRIVEAHYDSLRRLGISSLPGEKKYKHWKRWEWDVSQRLNEDGTIANIEKHLFDVSKRLSSNVSKGDTNRTTNSNWSFIGPSTTSSSGISTAKFKGLGRVDRIAFHPTDPDIIYIGTPSGGLWKTSNGGASWTPLTDFLPSIGISGIVIHPDSANIIYVLTGDGDSNLNNSAGILKSTDSGLTWALISNITSTPFLGFQLVMRQDIPNILWAATSVGLYRSADGGKIWTQKRAGVVYDIELHPSNSAILYGCSPTDVFRATNGSAFTSLPFDIAPSNGRKALAVTPADPDAVYLLAGPRVDTGAFNGFYRSDSIGTLFVRQTTTPNLFGRTGSDANDQSSYDIAIAASPTNGALVVTGGLIVFKTINSGVNFNAITSYSEDNEPWYVHPDVHDLKYNEINGYLYAATDGGFYKSTDDGETWEDISEGIETTMFYNMAGYNGDETFLIGGTQDNGVKHRGSNTSDFAHIDCCDGFEATFAANSSSTMYATLNSWLSRYTYSGSGYTKTDITPRSIWFMRVASHVTDIQRVFAGGDKLLFRSSNQGANWDTVVVEAKDGLEMCPSNPMRMYIAGRFEGEIKLNRTDDLGDSFVRLDDNPGFPSDPSLFISKIAVHPSDADRVWVSLVGMIDGKKIFYSDDAGATWTNLTFNLPNIPFNSIAIQSNGDVFVGSWVGAFYKPSGYSDWIPFANNLPRTRITDLVINEGASLIRASTYGRGVWESPLPNGTCDINKTWVGSPSVSGYQYYEVSNQIVTDFTIIGGANTQIYLKAGNAVDLMPGFVAPSSGIVFRAVAGPCNSGWTPDDN